MLLRCPFCDSVAMEPDTLFCEACGEALAEPVTGEEPAAAASPADLRLVRRRRVRPGGLLRRLRRPPAAGARPHGRRPRRRGRHQRQGPAPPAQRGLDGAAPGGLRPRAWTPSWPWSATACPASRPTPRRRPSPPPPASSPPSPPAPTRPRPPAPRCGPRTRPSPRPPGTDRNPPACTLVSAVVGTEVTVGWLGDSRAYWLGSRHQQQTARRRRERLPRHLRLARRRSGAPAAARRAVRARAGVVPARSDGLWNYVQDAEALAALALPLALLTRTRPPSAWCSTRSTRWRPRQHHARRRALPGCGRRCRRS